MKNVPEHESASTLTLRTLGLCLCLSVTAAAQMPADFICKTASPVVDVWASDLNRDGFVDLAISMAPDASGLRHLKLCYQTPAGNFVTGQELPLSSRAIAYDAAPGRLAFLTTDGMTVHEHTSDGFPGVPSWGLHISPWLLMADSRMLPRFPMILDSCRYAPLTPQGFHIHCVSEDSIVWQTVLKAPPALNFTSQPGAATVTAPRLQHGLLNNDTIPDAFVISGARVSCFLNSDRPAPDGRPPTWQYDFTQHSLHQSILAPLGDADTQIIVADLNGDGLSDAAAVRVPRARFNTDVGQVRLYYNEMGHWPRKPDQIITLPHFTGTVDIDDFNHDGRPDLALSYFSTGMGQALRYLLTQKIQLGCAFFYQTESGHYAEKPDIRFTFNRSVALSRLIAYAVKTYHVVGSDRHHSLLAVTGTNEWTLFKAHPENGFDRKDGQHFHQPADSRVFISDLNGDGLDDFCFYPPQQAGTLAVYFQRSGQLQR